MVAVPVPLAQRASTVPLEIAAPVAAVPEIEKLFPTLDPPPPPPQAVNNMVRVVEINTWSRAGFMVILSFK